ncbi:hypothetical protein LOTGIDRAFT_133274 [Lottia gigantea]|uniref:Uncharacterized protein n=1 Tax=Lottia gigantea TaxID=225164 RepID=V3YZC8_LOTGI|nr:hypothetical protein LOTGIDRAFT_133274 [Lottia gigantea]ESO83528.1 hypothetical protein LOTGIDRAFT_133274 [Lottia gigantea]
MSRRASLLAKQNKTKPKVRFPDELVFLDNVKENDLKAMDSMLRRASLQMDLNALNDAGLTPLHQACLDGNYGAVRMLVSHGADINRKDTDCWTPLHAACAEGHAQIVKYLLKKGGDYRATTDKGERPLDLVEPTDFKTISVMLAKPSTLKTESDEEEVGGDENANS